MGVLRFFLTGLLAIIALATGLLAAMVLVFTAIGRRFRQRQELAKNPSTQADGPKAAKHTVSMHSGDVIDVEATRVPADPVGRQG